MEIKVLASGSKGNAYMVSDGNTKLLLECGIQYKQIQKGCGFRLSEIRACLISHEHQDHSKAVKDIMRAGIDCYISAGTAEALEVSGHRANIIKAKQQFRIGTWTILPFETQHDAAEPLGFLLANQAGDKLLYITDSFYCRYCFQGLTHIMIEANYSLDILNGNVESGSIPKEMKKRVLRSHMSIETVKEFLKANDLSKVQEIWLLHLSEQNSCEKRFKEEVQKITGKPTYIA
jgi:phosphoribosyl 1,2-cyclic phosphodiesterase